MTPTRGERFRHNLVLFGLAAMFIALGGRLYYIQVLRHDKYLAAAEAQTRLGPFPDARKMRLVAARMEDGGRLGAIRDALEPELERFGVPPDGRGFKAHLTMARVKGSRGIGELAEALKPYQEKSFGECRVEGLTLFMSELSPRGSTYTALARIPLGG